MFIRAGTSAYWDCPGCGAELQFDFERRKKVAVYSSLVMAPAIALAFFDLWWAAIPALGLSLWVWTYDSVTLRRQAEAFMGKRNQAIPLEE